MNSRRPATLQNDEMARHGHQSRADEVAQREILSILAESGFAPGQGIEGLLGRFYRGDDA